MNSTTPRAYVHRIVEVNPTAYIHQLRSRQLERHKDTNTETLIPALRKHRDTV